MTANRRIFLNIVATYGRSLYALVIGLVCGWGTLMAVGEVDMGLMGVEFVYGGSKKLPLSNCINKHGERN